MPRLLTPRLIGQLRVALLSDCDCADLTAKLEADIERMGLTGAEIDAVQSGRSFDVQIDVALALGCAIKNGDGDAIALAHQRAERLCFTPGELDELLEKIGVILNERPDRRP